jgi:hypothetical protein
MSESFVSIFRQMAEPPARGKYLSRLFGVFSEEIVRIWTEDPRSTYENLGRPTIKRGSQRTGSTVDFTLRHKQTGHSYAAELKCEIEYQNYRYLVLSDPEQLDHHKKEAFTEFLDLAARSQDQHVFVKGQEIKVDGAILIWGAVTPEGRSKTIKAKGFFDILSLAEMIDDLKAWNNESYQQLVAMRRAWANELFDSLI